MELLEKYIIARWCYAIGENYIDDAEYRYIEDKLKEQMPNNEYIKRSWSDDPCPIDLLEQYQLMEYYRDIKFLHKSESIDSIISEDVFRIAFYGLHEKTRVSFKIDGFNIQANYYNGKFISAETRGRTGNSLNANIIKDLLPQTISILGKVKVTGECSIPMKQWKEYQLETGNTSQRNSTSTALARGDLSYLSYLAFHIQAENEVIEGNLYEVLQNLGFKTPMCMYVNDFDSLSKAVDVMGKRNRAYGYLTDGLVVENKEVQMALRIRTWKEEMLRSYVTGYIENPGLYGDSMVVTIKPIMVDGARRSKVNVTNLEYIKKANLRIGNPIAFSIRSAVNCVLNLSATGELQEEWEGKFEEYREKIDRNIS